MGNFVKYCQILQGLSCYAVSEVRQTLTQLPGFPGIRNSGAVFPSCIKSEATMDNFFGWQKQQVNDPHP